MKKSDPEILTIIVHEGTHYLQHMKGLKATILKLEIEAHLQEDFFRKSIGGERRFNGGDRSLVQRIMDLYPDWREIQKWSQ